MSASTLVLLTDLQTAHPELAAQVGPVVLSALALSALPGPLLVQWGLRLAGEDHRPDEPRSRSRSAP